MYFVKQPQAFLVHLAVFGWKMARPSCQADMNSMNDAENTQKIWILPVILDSSDKCMHNCNSFQIQRSLLPEILDYPLSIHQKDCLERCIARWCTCNQMSYATGIQAWIALVPPARGRWWQHLNVVAAGGSADSHNLSLWPALDCGSLLVQPQQRKTCQASKKRWFTVSRRRTPTSAMRQCHYRITVPTILTVPKKLLANTQWDYCTHENPKFGNHSKWLLDMRKRCNGLEGHCIACRPIYCLPTAPVCPCGPFILSHQAAVGQQQEPICSCTWEMGGMDLIQLTHPGRVHGFTSRLKIPVKNRKTFEHSKCCLATVILLLYIHVHGRIGLQSKFQWWNILFESLKRGWHDLATLYKTAAAEILSSACPTLTNPDSLLAFLVAWDAND